MKNWVIGGLLSVIGVCAVLLVVIHPRPITSPRTLPTPPAAPPAPCQSAEEIARGIDPQRMRQHIRVLAGDIGVRRAGSATEARAREYVAGQLRQFGYDVQLTPVKLPGGAVSGNVIAELPGASPQAMLIGAHLDSKSPSPGANDNASGVAVLLELARVFRSTTPPMTCIFVAFGAEEMIDRTREHHHYGSRVLATNAALRKRLVCMTSLDMVGVGDRLFIGNQPPASNHWRDQVTATAHSLSLSPIAERSKPRSDHEAFARYGIPTAYLHWERDRAYHRRADVPARVNALRLEQTARLLAYALLRYPGSTDVPGAFSGNTTRLR